MVYKEVAWLEDVGGTPDQAWERYQRAQRYQCTCISGCTALTTLALTANRLYALPFLTCGGNHGYIRIGLTVTTLLAGNARMGIYGNAAGDVYPGTLILDAGAVDTSTTGLKEIVISQTLSPGLYWLVVVASSASTLRAIPVAGTIAVLGLDAAQATTPGNGWYVAFTYAPLPSTFPGGGTANTSSLPLVALLHQ